jgi:hypothetical protein
MAKQQRFIVLTIALVASAFEGLWDGDGEVLIAGLTMIVVGCILTIIQRSLRLIRRMETL